MGSVVAYLLPNMLERTVFSLGFIFGATSSTTTLKMIIAILDQSSWTHDSTFKARKVESSLEASPTRTRYQKRTRLTLDLVGWNCILIVCHSLVCLLMRQMNDS